MTLHLEVLDRAQRDLLGPLGACAASAGFYLGGTAVALYLGHRRSVDFDWFCPSRLADPLRLAQQARAAGLAFERSEVAPGTLLGVVSGVRLAFLEHEYPLFSELVRVDEPRLDLASPIDPGCLKLAAIAQRGSRKDFTDLFTIVTRRLPLPALVDSYQQKYSTRDVARLLLALTYFEGADAEAPLAMLEDVPWESIQRPVETWVKELAG